MIEVNTPVGTLRAVPSSQDENFPGISVRIGDTELALVEFSGPSPLKPATLQTWAYVDGEDEPIGIVNAIRTEGGLAAPDGNQNASASPSVRDIIADASEKPGGTAIRKPRFSRTSSPTTA